MTSLIEGYKYDIFISYRQKDNKGDRWVSEFVDALKDELESTFKEEISVYFDINPHDGLLETHDVDASLKGKLKCLIFIPIISRTYCDPKSFAWEHEFKVFIEQASKDEFGLKVKLPNGNVASRVLPVIIHDLDVADVKECESVLGGVIRGIEFIYKEAGVNKPLTVDDNENKNLNCTKYRIQVNKTANAIKEILEGMTTEPSEAIPERQKPLLEDKPPLKEKSIIVLPFENMSPDPDQEYFSDGLTEEIITDLSHINDLLVISRSSAMTFKGTKKKIGEIASDVNVRYVLEGSVRKAGNNLRITAQLIDGITDTHIWAEKYSGIMDDVFDIQEKVSRSIAGSLKLKLSNEENERISQKPIDNAQVYEYYLKAIKSIDSWAEKGLEQALDYIHKGLDISGDNVLLYFGIGYIYFMYAVLELKDNDECVVKLEQYAKKIFDLDSSSSYGYRLLGLINLRRSNLQQAIIQLKKYLSFNPNDLDALWWLGIIYFNTGKQHAIIPIAERLTNIDPFHSSGSFFYAWFYLLNGQFSESLEKGYQCYKLASEQPNIMLFFSRILAYNNQLEEAYTICDDIVKKYPTNLFAPVGQCYKFALQGDKEKTIKAISDGVKEKARYKNLYLAVIMAECDALIGEKDEAITSLECAVNLGAVNYPWYNEIDPFLENIRGEKRFKKLMERVKHEWENFEV
jgi:TolB-like protein